MSEWDNFSFSRAAEQAAYKHALAHPKLYESWRVSSIGKCMREHYLKRLGVKPTTLSDGNGQLRMMIGQAVHDLVADLFKEFPPEGVAQFESEVELYDKDLDLGGRMDDLFTFEEGYVELDDIKTQQEQAFWWMKKKSEGYTTKDGTQVSPRNIEEQKSEQFKQVRAYMFLRKRLGKPIDRAKLVWWSMDTSTKQEVHVVLRPEHEQEILDELAVLNDHWAKKTLPPCTCDKLYDGAGVGYCDYGDVDTLNAKGKPTKCCDESLAKGE